MAKYVDGYVLPVPKRNLPAYRRMAVKAAKVWKEHGALDYKECAGDDMKAPFGLAFPPFVKAKKSETVVFSFITFKSRAHRDRVNKAVMTDPRLAAMCDMNNLPFDCARMIYGGFRVLVEG